MRSCLLSENFRSFAIATDQSGRLGGRRGGCRDKLGSDHKSFWPRVALIGNEGGALEVVSFVLCILEGPPLYYQYKR